MAQSGIFRTTMRGFHKQEVLQYIEELNARVTAEQQALTEQLAQSQQEAAELRTQLTETTEALAASEANGVELQRLVDEYRRTTQELSGCAEQVNELNREKLSLNAQRVRAEQTVQEQAQTLSDLQATATQQKAELEAVKQENEAMQARLKEQSVVEEQRLRCARIEENYLRLQEENRRYRALIGSVGTFVAEVRQMNQGILDASCGKELEAIETVEERLALLTAQMEGSRQELCALKETLTERKATADARLSAMMERLEQNACAGTADEE